MRDSYHEELDALTGDLVEMTRLVRSAMARATTSLLDADLALAEGVIGADDAVDRMRDDIEQRALDLLARQQPVARDLRALVTAIQAARDLERMGDHAVHVAKIARRRHPESAVPPELHEKMLEMGQLAERLVAKVGSVIASRDVTTALELDADDDAMDRMHRRLFHVLLSPEWTHGAEPAIDITLAGRSFERFADHAVHVAQSVVYLVTGRRVGEAAGTAAG